MPTLVDTPVGCKADYASAPDLITIAHACRIVGGDEKPISTATYYRA